jgi:hypothetical protein
MDLTLELLFPYDFSVELFFQLSLIFFKLLLLFLFLIIEVNDVVIHRCDFFGLGLNDLLVILLDRVVIHLGVAFIANSMHLLVSDGELSRVLRTDFTDSFSTFFTMSDRVAQTGEWSLAKLTELHVWLPFSFDSFQVEHWRQGVCLVDELGLLLHTEASIEV